ncbi:MAG: DUF1499 domain-containing protein [Rhodospirillaceae bacterium]
MADTSGASFSEKFSGKACTLGLIVVILSGLAAALSGPLYQAGTLGLMQAFGVLRASIQYGLAAGAVLCLIGLILALMAYKGAFLGKSITGVIGLIIAGIVVYVPYSVQNGDFPPIHEITTDFDNPPAFIDIVPLRIATEARNPPEYVPVVEGFGRTVDVVAEQKDHYPDIQPVQFAGTNYEAVYAKALQGVKDMGWTLVSESPVLGRIEAYDTTAWFGFIDDVVIRIEAQPMAYELDIRSKSRVGFGDIGANAKRVRAYLQKVSG